MMNIETEEEPIGKGKTLNFNVYSMSTNNNYLY